MSVDRALLRAQLIRHEGKRKHPYRDTTGHLTVGVGRNIDAVPFSDDEIDLMLHNDIDRCIHDLVTFSWFPALDSVRQRALVDMRFNLGPGGFRGFKKFIAAMERGAYADASEHMLNSRWANQVGRRAIRLAFMVKTGIDDVRG